MKTLTATIVLFIASIFAQSAQNANAIEVGTGSKSHDVFIANDTQDKVSVDQSINAGGSTRSFRFNVDANKVDRRHFSSVAPACGIQFHTVLLNVEDTYYSIPITKSGCIVISWDGVTYNGDKIDLDLDVKGDFHKKESLPRLGFAYKQSEEGLLVVSVLEGSMADKLGLTVGQTVTGYNGFVVKTYEEFHQQRKLALQGEGRVFLTVKNSTDQSKVLKDSDIVDQGSLRTTKQYGVDQLGTSVVVQTTTWTSFGRPFSKTESMKVNEAYPTAVQPQSYPAQLQGSPVVFTPEVLPSALAQ